MGPGDVRAAAILLKTAITFMSSKAKTSKRAPGRNGQGEGSLPLASKVKVVVAGEGSDTLSPPAGPTGVAQAALTTVTWQKG